MINHNRDYIKHTYPEALGDCTLAIGDGWVPLVNNLTDSIINRIDRYNEYEGAKVNLHIVQIKEKFGELRYYIGFSNNSESDVILIKEIRKIVRSYEKTSSHICETCGMYGETVKNGGYLYTACEEHIHGKE